MKPAVYALATAIAFLITTTSALAGSGAGGVFNLGQTNTVNAKSTLTGATSDPELLVQNTGSGPALSLVAPGGVAPFKVNSTTKIVSLNADLLDGIDSAALQKRVTGTCASGQAIRVISATGGVTCQAVGGGSGSGWSLTGNAGTTPGTNFVGTTDNKALELKVNKQRALRLEPNATSPNVIGGFSGNSVPGGFYGATIAGGGEANLANRAQDNFATVGGGVNNAASGFESTIGGGGSNATSNLYSTVAGGQSNLSTGNSSTVGGGYANQATNTQSTVGGGSGNQATGSWSTVPGGYHNTASGSSSFAAGEEAVADDNNSFLWGDGHWGEGNGLMYTYAPYTFNAHATGGFNFWTNYSGPTTGCWIVAGGGSLTCSSSRYVKKDFAPVDQQKILKRVAHLPLTTWSYRNEKSGARHIGPMAQDFARAFSLGHGTTGIAMVDSDGIALAAIQGLYRQNQALQRQNRSLNARLARLEHAFSKLSR